MSITPKKFILLILGITSLLFSRATFLFIDDPEGPNLLIVIGLAVIIFVIVFGIYSLITKILKQ